MPHSHRPRKPLLRGTRPHNDHERPPEPPPFDPAVSAIIDHLRLIEEHLEEIDERFTCVQSLVEEMIP
jgi:hypothetical protein